MARLSTKHKDKLSSLFGSRVTFERLERKMYSHDIAAMPKLIKPLIRNTIPDAVVQPENEAQLVELVQWAARNRIPLTPRGKASSGYGGVIPVKKGIVVDFYWMKDVLDINAGELTASVT